MVLSSSSLIGELCDGFFFFGSIVMFCFLFPPVFVFLLLSTDPIPPPPLSDLNDFIVFDRYIIVDDEASFLILDLFISFQASSANVGATAATRTVVAVVATISMLVPASVIGPIMILVHYCLIIDFLFVFLVVF